MPCLSRREKVRSFVRYRRHPALVVWWEGAQPVLHNYVRKKTLRPEPEAVEFVSFFHEWRTLEETVERFPAWPKAVLRGAVARLHTTGVLLAENDPTGPEDAIEDWEWSLPVRFAHMAVRNLDYVGANSPEQAQLYLERMQLPQPPLFKRYPDCPRVRLPNVLEPCNVSLDTALLRRATCRDWKREPISLGALARLLYLSWGVTGCHIDAFTGPLPHKTSPSGGSRHPTEVYPVVLNVDGLEPGIYHYASAEHELELLRRGQFGALISWIAAEQTWLGDAAVICVMTSAVRRNQWKYPTDRAYRVITLDLAHLSQTFYLVATALGLGAFTTAAFRDRDLERELGVDSAWEPAMSLCAAGAPDERAVSSLRMSCTQAEDGSIHIQDPPWQPSPWPSDGKGGQIE